MVTLLKQHNVVGTFPVTALIVKRHPELLSILEGMEVAVHGYKHTDVSKMSREYQETMLREALDIFSSLGLKPTGHRAPYLRLNETTLDVVSQMGLLYDSSVPSMWRDEGESNESKYLKNAFLSYGLYKSGNQLPVIRGRLVILPVAIPDDEILIDRLRINEKQLTTTVIGMGKSALSSGGHLVLQLHPERFHLFHEALETVLNFAQEHDAWIAPLKDVALWWRDRQDTEPRWPDNAPFAISISGDIDAVTLTDFGLRIFGR